MRFTITAASSALFSTWIFIEELGLLFDAGDGVSASLAQKTRKVRHVFITHADRDHVAGLLQLHQLVAQAGRPAIHYPADCGSFPGLRDFVKHFDPQSGPATWVPLRAEQSVPLSPEFSVRTKASAHIEAEPGKTKALGFSVVRSSRVLREEFRGLPSLEIARLRGELGANAITDLREQPVLGYSGDSPILEPGHWNGVRFLLHECTFLEPEAARRAHANLPQVLAAAALLPLEALILLHFSSRYTAAEISEAVVREASTVRPSFPIFVVPPGEVVRDVLGTRPFWTP